MKRLLFAIILCSVIVTFDSCSKGGPDTNWPDPGSTKHGGGLPDPNSLYKPNYDAQIQSDNIDYLRQIRTEAEQDTELR